MFGGLPDGKHRVFLGRLRGYAWYTPPKGAGTIVSGGTIATDFLTSAKNHRMPLKSGANAAGRTHARVRF